MLTMYKIGILGSLAQANFSETWTITKVRAKGNKNKTIPGIRIISLNELFLSPLCSFLFFSLPVPLFLFFLPPSPTPFFLVFWIH